LHWPDLSGTEKMMKKTGKNALNEYWNIEVGQICLGRLPVLGSLLMGSIESLAKSGQSYANGFMVEGLLALGTAIRICLAAILVMIGW